ncbi:Histidine kinase [Sulfidibacter corallicola]|uniref:histidine kinase n=1 Tax=Sulfidibacter corallicola TaxID=2818388 RepID=A0A8A4TH50_SULCO|nr:ATP-binding protein [Sulfidibacter corallicola]QTD48953.1 HAMP domain-containing protein [Sulfidibacter corallicola]
MGFFRAYNLVCVFLAIQVFTVCFPHSFLYIAQALVGAFAFAAAMREWKGRSSGLILILVAAPLLLWIPAETIPQPGVPQNAALHLMRDFHLESWLEDREMQGSLALLRGKNPRLGNPESGSLFRHADLPAHDSVTLFNLNMEPLVWQGNYFSESYEGLTPGAPALGMRDGRLFLQVLVPLPSAEQAEGFLCLETLLVSSHFEERSHTWLVAQDPAFRHYQPRVVEPGKGRFLVDLAETLTVPALPYDLSFFPDHDSSLLFDAAALGWVLALVAAFFLLFGKTPVRFRFVPPLLALVALGSFAQIPPDDTTVLASYIFGTTVLGGLLISPFHLFLSSSLAFLVLLGGRGALAPKHPLWSLAFLVLAAGFVMFGADALQQANVFSYIHPLEALDSPGALLSYLGFLSLLACLLHLMDRARWERGLHLAIALGLVVGVCLFLQPERWQALGSLALLALAGFVRAPASVRAAVGVLFFYPNMVFTEHRQELDFVRNQILDEITLLGERNHFRIGRLIGQLEPLTDQIDHAPHEHLMEMFAQRCGLLEEQIDFAMRLSSPQGEAVSEVDQHISLDRIPYYHVPLNQVESITSLDRSGSDRSGPGWLVFRTLLSSVRGDYELVVVLGNDYQNLSLVRQLGRLQGSRYPFRSRDAFPYFAYILDVYDGNGRSLYNQGDPVALTLDERERLKEEVYFWKPDPKSPRNTLFFFSGSPFLYRITHKATPLRMIFVRYLALFLAAWLILRLIRLGLGPTRSPLANWRRSFALKMAGFMFLSSVLPTATLGYLLIKSIRKNQVREVEAIARSNILAAKNLFIQYLEPQNDELTGGGGDAEVEQRTREFERSNPRNLPVQRFSRILNEDLSLYLDGRVYKTHQPEVFREGILNRRLSFDLVRSLIIENKPYTFQQRNLPDGSSIWVSYSPLRLTDKHTAVLSMTMIPFNRRQSLRWEEQLEFSVTVLAGLFFLMAGLTRFLAQSFLRPVSAITRGAMRMAKGIQNRPIIVHRQDELERMVSAFNSMQERIQLSQSRLKEQLDVLDETLKATSGGLVGFDREGRVLLQNQMAWELLDMDSIPQTFDELLAREPQLVPLREAVDAEWEGECNVGLSGSTGRRELLVKARAVPGTTERGIRLILAIEDITHAMEAGRFKAWSEMARRVAHEIKNPLTPIQLEIDYLVKLYQDEHPEFGPALLETKEEISRQVEILRRTATEFSDYARPVTLAVEPFDLTHLVHDLVSPYEKAMTDLELVVTMPDRLEVEGDARLLRRSLHNLIVNAVQAMERRGRLRIEVRAEPDAALITIEDTGPGIPLEDQPRVFEAYFSTKDQGTGLGLVIAKRYVQLHEGSLHIDPDYREGTRFQVRIPLRQPEVASETTFT